MQLAKYVPQELSATCMSNTYAGVPGQPPNRIQDDCVSEATAQCIDGGTSCAHGLSACRAVPARQ